jgi:hypothetical protein
MRQAFRGSQDGSVDDIRGIWDKHRRDYDVSLNKILTWIYASIISVRLLLPRKPLTPEIIMLKS